MKVLSRAEFTRKCCFIIWQSWLCKLACALKAFKKADVLSFLLPFIMSKSDPIIIMTTEFIVCWYYVEKWIALFVFPVPSRAPSGIQLSNVQFNDVKVQWDPLPRQYINGPLLGYRVYYQEDNLLKAPLGYVDTRNPFANMVTLKGLKTGFRYRIQIAAFTSKGVGPKSYNWQYITVGGFNDGYTTVCLWVL